MTGDVAPEFDRPDYTASPARKWGEPMNKTTRPLRWTAALLIGAVVPSFVHASAFQILEQSPARLGTAFAGTASTAADPSTVFFNPAGMARLEGRQYSVAGNLIRVNSVFDNGGSRTGVNTDNPRSTSAFERPLPGEEGATNDPGLVPNVYYVQPLKDDATVGIGLNAPFGLASSYDADWQGRYHATDSELQTINLNLTLAFSVTDALSLGVGASHQQAETTLENEVDSFNACFQAGGSESYCASAHGGPGNRSADSSATIEGEDEAIVFDLSLHWQPTSSTELGVVWRQGAAYTLTGTADFDKSTSCEQDARCRNALDTQAGNVKSEVDLPDTVTLSASQELGPPLTLHADLAWTEWSVLQEISIENTDNGRTIETLELDYEDTWRLALGATYRTQGAWSWRVGTGYDQAPQTDPSLVTPRIPDQDRAWLGFGSSYRLSPRSTIDFGYAHLFVDEIEINNVEQRNRLKGDFDASVDIFGIQYTGRF